MRTIVKLKFGSHLYGTSTPASDVDLKSVFVPDARDILLQRVRGTISNRRSKAEGVRNVAGDVDEEAYSLQRYLELAAEGQTVALDILFAPRSSMLDEPTWEWKIILQERHRLLTRKSASFIGYCRQQANKYGIKGSRVAAARQALGVLAEALERFGNQAKLREIEPAIQGAVGEHSALTEIPGATDVHGVRRTVRHWDVCGRKLPLTQTIKASHEIVRRLVEEYGHRAVQAESQRGIDWKALSHAVRVGRQACELLTCGEVTFPRPEAAHLLAIKLGQLPYQVVSAEIETLLEAVERAAELSTLPEVADRAWIDDFVVKVYEDRCRK